VLALSLLLLAASLALSGVLIPFVALGTAWIIGRQTSSPQLQIPGAATTMMELRDLAHTDASAAARYTNFVISPSYAVLRQSDVGMFQETQRAIELERVAAATMGAVLSASNGERRELDRALDRDRATRWSTHHGAQRGDEWMCARFERAELLRGIELSPGTYASDFPRGLTISAAADCLEPLTPDSPALSIVGRFPSWQGAVLYTPSGLPYFSGQNDVKVRFGAVTAVRCVCAMQTGTNDSFDWSVADVYGLVEKGKTP
jgi:hypothetical protein